MNLNDKKGIFSDKWSMCKTSEQMSALAVDDVKL